MLIDASHAEETRVVVLDGNRLEDFDVETVNRKQIKGNIYLAKVIRVEPSLQAAFVEYGGNRHGFLAFGEIHPDYYQIPVADREKLLALQAEEAEAARAEEDAQTAAEATPEANAQPLEIKPIEITSAPPPADEGMPEGEVANESTGIEAALTEAAPEEIAPDAETPADETAGDEAPAIEGVAEGTLETVEMSDAVETIEPESAPEAPPPENLGGDGDDAVEARERRMRQRFLRNYKIQDVIHRRQIMLIQVVKEERGNKGAALTTYLSLAGRFSVLMPNSPTGGGVSRKITSQTDRRRLKETMAELDVPQGMGLIVRTAGANRPKPEIKRDCEYLLRLWDDIRDKTMESSAPALIYEEASLIKRSIRDVYTRDVEEILVDGDEGFRNARDFMRMLMPANASKVQFWTEGQPLFAKYQVEAQLDAMLNPIVQLRSGGYIVINQTEALVAIDVNSGRSTRERNIEDTALRTNLEAAEEVAKQLRMRDLAGLIVIDFIDMESRRNNAAVERKLKDALKHDRARIQIGSISHFGLMEMSRQRLRPSLTEASLIVCPHCAGMGHIRSPESAALHILRAIEDEGAKFRSAEISVTLPPDIAFYLFNHKRERLSAIEARYSMRVIFVPDGTLTGTNFRIEKLRAHISPPPVPVIPERRLPAPVAETVIEEEETETEAESEETETSAEKSERKRRRRRRGKRRTENNAPEATEAPEGEEQVLETSAAVVIVMEDDQQSEIDLVMAAALGEAEAEPEMALAEPLAEPPEETARKPRRARSGSRRRKGEEAVPAELVFTDVADIFEAAERAEEQTRRPRRAPRQQAKPVEVTAELLAPETAEQAEHMMEPPAQAAEPMVEERAAEPMVEERAAEPMTETKSAPEAVVVKPIVVGAEAPTEKKRGWWRR
jgi:ribonuclease E